MKTSRLILNSLRQCSRLLETANVHTTTEAHQVSNFTKKSIKEIKEINDKLRQNPEATYGRIFQDRIFKHKTDDQLRWSGGLVVTLTPGPHYGHWYDFKKEVGGSPIRAIMENLGVDECDAIEVGLKFLQDDPDLFLEKIDFSTKNETMEKMKKNIQVTKQNNVQLAQDLWHKSVPIKGTLGQVYLSKFRRIPEFVHEKLAFRFLQTDNNDKYSYKVSSMVLIPILDSTITVQGVQRIFLSEEGKKLGKFTLGALKNNAGLIQDGSVGQVLVIAEGPETAASIATIFEGPILASLSLGNMKNMAEILIQTWKPRQVIIAADFDGEKELFEDGHEEVAIVSLTKELQKANIEVVIKRPLALGSTKCDWNDILVQHGIEGIKKEFS